MDVYEWVEFKCPRCGSMNMFDPNLLDDGLQIVWCDEQDGGCGMPLVIRPRVKVTADVWPVEGWGDENAGNH